MFKVWNLSQRYSSRSATAPQSLLFLCFCFYLGQFIYHKCEFKLGDRHGPKYNKRKIEKSNGEYNSVDCISEMPDEILVSILSLLPQKEAAATSTLSRRRQYRWMSTMTLNFDVNFHLRRNRARFIHTGKKLRDLECCRYVNWVDRVMELTEELKKSSVVNWICMLVVGTMLRLSTDYGGTIYQILGFEFDVLKLNGTIWDLDCRKTAKLFCDLFLGVWNGEEDENAGTNCDYKLTDFAEEKNRR